MVAPSKFPSGAVPRPSAPSDANWSKKLIDRLSSTRRPEQDNRLEPMDSVAIPPSPSIPGTSQLQPITTTPPNSPVSVKGLHTSESHGCNRPSRNPINSRQNGSSRQITVNKIKIYVTIEVITEDGGKTCKSPEIHSDLSTIRIPQATSKRRPRLQIRYARSPSPTPIKPCPITHVTRRSALEEDCSICSTSLASEPVENLVWCKGACGNNFHKSCFDEWRVYAARPLRCVHCRAIWRRSCKHDHEKAGSEKEDVDAKGAATNLDQRIGTDTSLSLLSSQS